MHSIRIAKVCLRARSNRLTWPGNAPSARRVPSPTLKIPTGVCDATRAPLQRMRAPRSCTPCAAGLTTVDGIVCQSCPNNVCATPMPPPPPLRCLHGNGTVTAENVKQRDCDGVRADAFCFVQEPVGFENETLRFCVPASSPLCTGGVDAQATANRLRVRIKFACCRKDDCNLDVASADVARGGDSNQNRTTTIASGSGATDSNGNPIPNASNSISIRITFIIMLIVMSLLLIH
jgi:hypothetical protein